MEEEQDGNDPETQRREIELLRQEGTMSLAELLSTLKRPLSQVGTIDTGDWAEPLTQTHAYCIPMPFLCISWCTLT